MKKIRWQSKNLSKKRKNLFSSRNIKKSYSYFVSKYKPIEYGQQRFRVALTKSLFTINEKPYLKLFIEFFDEEKDLNALLEKKVREVMGKRKCSAQQAKEIIVLKLGKIKKRAIAVSNYANKIFVGASFDFASPDYHVHHETMAAMRNVVNFCQFSLDRLPKVLEKIN